MAPPSKPAELLSKVQSWEIIVESRAMMAPPVVIAELSRKLLSAIVEDVVMEKMAQPNSAVFSDKVTPMRSRSEAEA